ncbi:hypothetical protein ACFE04_027316 [Oxalis oulophora]
MHGSQRRSTVTVCIQRQKSLRLFHARRLRSESDSDSFPLSPPFHRLPLVRSSITEITILFNNAVNKKVPDHQVAGHRAIDGKLGPLVDDHGRFYKPLQAGQRGSIEEAFYKSFATNVKVPDHVRKFFPAYHGTQLVQATDGSGLLPHLVLEDVVAAHTNASVIDIKIGSRTWYPQASDRYIQKSLDKDRNSTSVALGFRLSGLQVYESKRSEYWKPTKKFMKELDVDGVRLVLRKFVSTNVSDDSSKPDCALASGVYGEILGQLRELKAWLEVQTIYHFNSCSVLILYDEQSELNEKNSRAEVKLVDFAHVMEANGVIDHNFLGGLCSLIKFISDIQTGSDEKDSEEKSCATINGS